MVWYFMTEALKQALWKPNTLTSPMAAFWENGQLTVKNKYDFRNFSEFDFTWEVTADGNVTSRGSLELAAKGHESVTVPLHLEIPESKYGTY